MDMTTSDRLQVLEANPDLPEHEEAAEAAAPVAGVRSDAGERRRHTRYRLQLPAVVTFGAKRYRLQTEDVAAAGVFVRMDDPPALRQMVSIGVELPDGSTFQTAAVVAWRIDPAHATNRVPGAGLQFHAVAADAHAVWEIFVKDVRVAAQQVASEPSPPATPEPIRRRYPRYPACFEVRPRDSEGLMTFFTRDVSGGGMFMATTLDIAVGTEIDLDLVHPDNGAVFALSGVVRRVVPGEGLGLEFTQMTASLRQALWQFIEHGLPDLDAELDDAEPA